MLKMLSIAVAVIGMAGCTEGDRQKAAAAAASQKALESAARERVAASCMEQRQELLGKAAQLLKNNDAAAAVSTLEPCVVATGGDAHLKSAWNVARAAGFAAVARDRTQSTSDRLEAIRTAGLIDKPTYQQLSALEAQLIKTRESEAAAVRRAEAARKRKEGVSIGMSKEDVLASSWGKPRKVNSTHNRYGTHEQWVYDGGYLYFDDGVLTSIQN